MSKNVIFEALAFLNGYNPSPSMKGMRDSNQVHEIYIKNAVISLISIKKHNPDTDVGIVVNFELGDKWKNEFVKKGLIVWQCPFKKYHMPKSIVYSLSYYKLCAFQFLLNETFYERYCFIDCDTFAVRDFSPVWDECNDAFMIVPGDEGVDHPVRKEIIGLYKTLHGIGKNITHYCSGFIISSRINAVKVLDKCSDVYEKIVEINAKPIGGDEIVWSLALSDMDINIYSPKVYCLLANIGFREYWVDKADYRDPHIVMWHLPTEKRYALIWLYEYYVKNKALPDIEKMAKVCRIRRIKNKFSILSLQTILKDPTAIKRNLMKAIKR